MSNKLYRAILTLAVIATITLSLAPPATAQDGKANDTESEVTLFKNVKVFNGTENMLHEMDVLVVKNKIHKIAKDIPTSGTWEVDMKTGGAKQTKGPGGGLEAYTFNTFEQGKTVKKQVKVNVIDGGGRTLMPGLIDSHVHLNFYKDGTLIDLESSTWEEIGARAAAMAKEMLEMGFTTVRDMGGTHDGLKKVIDQGLLPGPRIYCAGGFISQTSGHGDFGLPAMRKGEANVERLEIARMVDGRNEVLQAGRRNFALGAHYLKVMVSGGVTSVKDPIYASQFSDDEVLAAVETAEDWGSYVAVHVFQDDDILRALNLGVKCIDHGLTISDESMKLLVEKDAFLSPNCTALAREALAHPMHQDPTFPPTVKFMWLFNNSSEFFNLCKKYKPKLVFNSDYVLLTGDPFRASMDFTKYNVADRFGNFWALQMLTKNGGELCELTGPENPYADGKLGVIEEGAYADILIVDGNPLEDITTIGANSQWFDAAPRSQDVPPIKLIMKDGKVYKNTLK
ncbi:isoaspartyl dipeptidase [Symmachiella macrocystis]|uniref:Isoaspartyl dipeptidase n=1 Tax=Symmachiella macrocystis TaxID=2527985 RepID=A0A5C6BKS2_9PLAN|nr:amidohydrolase family protein [Symmachiella macrocystis]TWU12121.1 isoaspartyl dipeptidase [Symmachiella macrocystis]